MTETTGIFLRVYAPIAIGLLVLALIRAVKEGASPLRLSLQFPFLSVDVPTPKWLGGQRAGRLLFACIGLASIALGVSADFSQFFPQRLRMDVYFDDGGIVRELASLSAEEQRVLRIAPPPWTAQRTQYTVDVTRHLAELYSAEVPGATFDASSMNPANTHARGETTFVVTRDDWIRYRITEANGELALVSDVPGRRLDALRTLFALADSPSNFIRPSLRQLFFGQPIVLAPRFKQIFRPTNAGISVAPFDHIVVGVTKVRVMPLPSFSSTLYLVQQSDATLVPVGYAIYY